jgi:hypothetical protein
VGAAAGTAVGAGAGAGADASGSLERGAAATIGGRHDDGFAGPEAGAGAEFSGVTPYFQTPRSFTGPFESPHAASTTAAATIPMESGRVGMV